jgi:uncharacterized repeat protein (TIGR01451 family)
MNWTNIKCNKIKNKLTHNMIRFINTEFKTFQSIITSKTALMVGFMLLLANIANAQITFNNNVPAEISVCADAKTFDVAFKNISGATLAGLSVEVTFPTGVVYQVGSVTGGATESNTSNLSKVTFALPNLANGSSAVFNVKARASYAALAGAQSGIVFKNTVKATWTGGTKSAQTGTYNVLYPALSIISATDAAVFAGQVFTRTVSIVNGGFGSIGGFTLTDTYNGSILTLQSVNKGSLTGNVITFGAADFATVGDGDGLFEQNETLVVTQTIQASGCTSTQSTLVAKWGCEGSLSESNKKFPKTTVELKNPNLVVTAQSTFNTCLSTTGDLQGLTIRNTGSGPTKTTQVVIAANTTDMYTSVDVNSIIFQVGTSPATPLTAAATTAAALHACLGTGAKAGFTVNLPTIEPGQTVYVKWKTNTCATTACGQVNLIGWKYNATYNNACGTQSFTTSDTGQSTKSKDFSTFVENPSDLYLGNTGEYVFTLNSASFKLPTTSSSYFQVEIDLPAAGLVWSGNNSDLAFKSGVSAWTPTSVVYTAATRKLVAKYPFPMPINLPYAEIRVKLKADCANLTVNPVALGFALYYVMDGTCTNPHKFSLTCASAPVTLIHCPGNTCVGMSFRSFDVKRHNVGKPDNDQNGIADGSGALDLVNIALNRVMASDTFKTTFTGKVFTSATIPTWSYAYAKSTFAKGNSTTAMWATLTVTDASTGAVKTATLTPFANTVASNNRTTTWNLSPAAIGGTFAGFVYENEDIVTLTAYYKLSGNIGAKMEQINFTNEMYTTTSTAASATKYQCETWLGNITFVGYQLKNTKSDQYNVESCTKTISQNYGLYIGQTGVGAGMDMFPYEYRNWAIINDLNVVLPENYAYVSSIIEQDRTRANGLLVNQTTNITPSSTVGQQLNFSLANYSTSNGGTLLLSDDGFNGTVKVEIKPTCGAVTDINFAVPWQLNYKESATFGGAVTPWLTATADQIKYSPAKFTFTSADQIVEAVSPTIFWEVDIKNNTGTGANNSWFYLKSANGRIQVKAVIDRVTNAILTPDANGFYKMNTTAASGFKKIKIEATYNNCLKDDLDIFAGYSCDGYPANFSAISCPYQSYKVTYEPQEAELQFKMRSYSPPGNDCNLPITVELDLLSSKFSAITDIEVKLTPTPGSGIKLKSGSTKYAYPVGANLNNFQVPNLVGGTYTIATENLVPSLAATGLPGVGSPSANLFKLKFDIDLGPNYRPGETIAIQINSNKPCGASNVASNYTFDPAATFNRETGIGLDGALDAWSLSWVDMDSDGDQDLFVGTASGTDPNAMFKNNGNGTFTKVTSGAIVTENTKSYASTWADIDNDGDMDGFVATEVGQKNLLYINNGGGNFTKITNDDAVNETGYGRGASFADYDNDGFVDLLVTDYFATKFNLIFHNNGNGTFKKVTDNPIANEAASSVSASWADYNNDGLNDVFICNTNDENNSLYKNIGNGQFEKITAGVVVTDGGKSIGSSWGDIDNDGDLDLFVANGGNQYNFLYKNEGNGSFSKISTGDLVTRKSNASGSSFIDYDNDGDLDIFVTDDNENGNSLYANDGRGLFKKVNNNMDNDLGLSSATAWADVDSDGDMDALVANRNGNEMYFYENSMGQCQTNVCMTLKGSKSNRSAIGAKVFVKAKMYGIDTWQMRQISTQTGGGIGGQNDIRAIFGLGDATQVDSIRVVWPSGFVQLLGAKSVNQCYTIEEPQATKICGTIWIDTNEDCIKDANEPAAISTRVLIQPGNYYAVTDKKGNYEAYLAVGNYTLTPEPRTGFSVICPISTTGRDVNITALGQTHCGQDFGLKSACSKPDLSVEITATALRVGFKNLIAINWRNNGTAQASGLKIDVDFGEFIVPQSATIPWEKAAGKTFSWSLPDLMMSETGTFYVTAFVPTTVPINQLIEMKATVVCDDSECIATDNTHIINEYTVGALDPNDIAVSPEGNIRTEQQLTYKIRFQNVGTIAAKTVVVEDLLPEGLDLSTLEFGAASHAYRLQISENGRLIRWIFDNINLLDSVNNEALSHGFVTFRIRPNYDITEGTVLPNSASIWFDNLQAIKTNVVVNTIKTPIKQVHLTLGQLEMFPNPTTDVVNISLAESREPAISFEVYKVNGSLLKTYENPEKLTDYKIYTSDWEGGVYFIQATTEEGKLWRGRLVVIH